MKILTWLFVLAFVLTACTGERELQVERTLLKLNGIDTLYRVGGDKFLYKWYDLKHQVVYDEYADSMIAGTQIYMAALINK